MTDLIDLETRCSYCGADPTWWCVTVRTITRDPGHAATFLHAARMRPIRAAYMLGSTEARAATIDGLVWRLRAAREGHRWTPPGVPRLADDTVESWLRSLIDPPSRR